MAGSSTCGNAEIFQVFKALSQTPFVMETILPETQMETLKSGKIQPESRICRRGKGVCRGVVTAFHQNEPVLALKVRVAAHSPPQPPNPPSCRGLCTAVASEQTKEDKMASLQLWLRVLGLFLLLFAFQGEFSSFLPYS